MSLTAQQEKAIDALIENKTLSAAADAAGISRRTLYNYLHDEKEFARAYKAAIEQTRLERLDSLKDARQAAIDTIIDIMKNSDKAGIRLKAAESVLKLTAESEDRADKVIEAAISKDPLADLFS